MENRPLDFGVKELALYIYRDSLVPELFELLGEELTMELIQIFGGTRIVIPPYKKFLDMKRNLEIYESMSVCNSNQVITSLAKKYEITEVWVRELYDLMKRQVNSIREYLDSSKKNGNLNITTERNPRREA